MGYIIIGQGRRRPNNVDGLGLDWPSWTPWGKTDEQKAAETIANINQAIDQFRQAHEKAIALYNAGLLTEKTRQKHVELRDKLNNLLIKIFDAVSPEEYLEIHNYLANVRADVGLGIAPLLIIGGIALVAAVAVTAITVNRQITEHNKELETEIQKIELVRQGKAPAKILDEKPSADESIIEKLLGVSPAMIIGAVAVVALAPGAIKYIKGKIV